MAEPGAVSGVLGTGGESLVEGSTPEASSPLDPTAAALAAKVAENNPELSRQVSDYFRKQSHLVEIQTEHLHEQRVVNLQLLKLRRFDERLRVGLRVFVILIATVIGIFAAVLLHDAITSRSVVIEAFDLSPSLAAHSLSGKIVAAAVLDDLNRLQAATQGSTQKASITSAWDRDIKIEVAETGFSFGEISRALRERFGHDVRIDGDLLETAQGLVLAVRGTGVMPQTFIGGAADLSKLTRTAAEYIYAEARPALWATYLASVWRNEETVEFARTAVNRTEPIERARIFDVWSDAVADGGGSLQEALSLALEAVKLNPADWGAQNDVQEWLASLGEEEAACREGEAMQRLAGGRPGLAPEIQYVSWDLLTWNLPAATAALGADLDATGGAGTNFGPQWPWVAWMRALMHDSEGARFALSNARNDQGLPIVAASQHRANATLALELGDAVGAAQEWQEVAKEYKNPAVVNILASAICFGAPVMEQIGRHAEADEMLAAVGKLSFVDCYRFKADILDSRGDGAAAQEWYAKAIKLAPSLPTGYYSWGLALAKHGDLDGAVVKFKEANQKGPYWADPLKAWGDALVKQGKVKEALAKYDQALKYAPKWKQLKQAREDLAKQKA